MNTTTTTTDTQNTAGCNPPDDRLDGPIHEWFGLSYSNYMVLHRTLMQSMPLEWQRRAVALVDELHAAYAHLEQAPVYCVQAARECEYGDLSEADRRALDVLCSDDDPAYPKEQATVYWDRYGDEHAPTDRVLVPIGDDPVPHYNRGRTYLPPATPVAGDRQRANTAPAVPAAAATDG